MPIQRTYSFPQSPPTGSRDARASVGPASATSVPNRTTIPPGQSSTELPGENTDEGAMARLFLAEVEFPEDGDLREAKQAMEWMHCVLINRLKHPADFGADRHATRIVQIISPERFGTRFKGFDNYPSIDAHQKDNIAGKVNKANNKNSNQEDYKKVRRICCCRGE